MTVCGEWHTQHFAQLMFFCTSLGVTLLYRPLPPCLLESETFFSEISDVSVTGQQHKKQIFFLENLCFLQPCQRTVQSRTRSCSPWMYGLSGESFTTAVFQFEVEADHTDRVWRSVLLVCSVGWNCSCFPGFRAKWCSSLRSFYLYSAVVASCVYNSLWVT